jgi:hypothetical protein
MKIHRYRPFTFAALLIRTQVGVVGAVALGLGASAEAVAQGAGPITKATANAQGRADGWADHLHVGLQGARALPHPGGVRAVVLARAVLPRQVSGILLRQMT